MGLIAHLVRPGIANQLPLGVEDEKVEVFRVFLAISKFSGDGARIEAINFILIGKVRQKIKGAFVPGCGDPVDQFQVFEGTPFPLPGHHVVGIPERQAGPRDGEGNDREPDAKRQFLAQSLMLPQSQWNLPWEL
jgi:hypothetical protein